MIKPTKKLTEFIEMYPTRKAFAETFGLDEETVSRVMKEKRNVPESMILAIQTKLEWELKEIIEVVEDK